jgi:37-kD nucleoid-associated bacterial protein
MVTSNDLASLAIHRVIFHDVPRNPKRGAAQVILAEAETEVDAERCGHLKTRITRVLGSKSAYPILFDTSSSSPVPNHIRSFTKQAREANDFVAVSQQFAQHLFELQNGAISSGLLCVLDIAASGLPGIVLMKLEREEGARLEFTDKRTFAMSVLDNLVLTDGTRLFKTAMFVRTGADDDDFRSTACDSQLRISASDDMARFWLRFLGCTFTLDPRVATQRFYDSALAFINEEITDAIHKNDLYEHLQSQMKAEKRMFSPKVFIEEFVPENYHEAFREHLKRHGAPLANFTKDASDIRGRLRRLSYRTAHGATVQVPAENAEIVDIQSEQIIINDTLSGVDHK